MQAKSSTAADLAAIAICTLAWGTTWYAITLQFGHVDPIISIIYRFALAAVLLFAWAAWRREQTMLSAPQHIAALGVGLFTFAIDYAFVYWAEERIASAVVAVTFSALAFVNLAAFRLVYNERAPAPAWVAAMLGVAGVAILFWSELTAARLSARAATGLLLAALGVIAACVGNLFARRGEAAGAAVAASTAWAMAYGAGFLTLFALATGRVWSFDPSWRYVLSLLHLAVIGSVVAFALYFGLARRRGYGLASYIAALTPPLAMGMSAVFEGKTWPAPAFAGLILILAGQALLLRTRRPAAVRASATKTAA
ncbi:MAG: EamA family transporter [Alphaproteobacteria bacterium]|nr:EamA family transporter [Alphaproteobacteria bacterium]